MGKEATDMVLCAPIGLLGDDHLNIRFRDCLENCLRVFNLAEQAEIATPLHQAIPALRCIDFVTWDGMGWSWWLRYSRENGTRWVPFAMDSDCLTTRNILAKHQFLSLLRSGMDCEGILARVLDGFR
jgi:hypothetical protein